MFSRLNYLLLLSSVVLSLFSISVYFYLLNAETGLLWLEKECAYHGIPIDLIAPKNRRWDYDSGIDKVRSLYHYTFAGVSLAKPLLEVVRARVIGFEVLRNKIYHIWVRDGENFLQLLKKPEKLKINLGDIIQFKVEKISGGSHSYGIYPTGIEVVGNIIGITGSELNYQPDSFLYAVPDVKVISIKLVQLKELKLKKYRLYFKYASYPRIELRKSSYSKFTAWEPGECKQIILPGFATHENLKSLIQSGWWEIAETWKSLEVSSGVS